MKLSDGYNSRLEQDTELHMEEGTLKEKPAEKKASFLERVSSEVKEVDKLFNSGKKGMGDAFLYGYKKGSSIIKGIQETFFGGMHKSD